MTGGSNLDNSTYVCEFIMALPFRQSTQKNQPMRYLNHSTKVEDNLALNFF